MTDLDRENVAFLLEVLAIAIIEIRTEAYEVKNAKIHALSDLVHNLPGSLGAFIIDGKLTTEEILETLETRAGRPALKRWLDGVKSHLNRER